MRTVLLSTLALGAMVSVAAAEPLRLTDAQMEGVTAGAALVLVDAAAAALGDFSDARTRTETYALSGKRIDLVIGVGSSRAVGCCGEQTDADSAVTATGTGDRTHSAHRNARRTNGPIAYSHSSGWFVGVTYK